MAELKCQQILTTGPHKGQRCYNKAKFPIGNPQFCGIHKPDSSSIPKQISKQIPKQISHPDLSPSTTNTSSLGHVYVAAMNLRGIRAPKPSDQCLSLNATSAQAKASPERRDFSPMSPVEGKYKGYYSFENYWQSGKIFENIPPNVSKAYWLGLNESKRRFPQSKGKKILYASYQLGQQLDYINARKQVYVPEYHQLIINRPSTQKWKNLVATGHCVVVYDFDGPRDLQGNPVCLEVTLQMLINKINDPTFPFGHGYVIAAELAGISPTQYIS